MSCSTGIVLQNAAYILPPKQSCPKQQVKINNFAQWKKKIPPFKEVSKTLSHQKTSICMWQPDSSVCPSERRRRRRRHLLVSNYGRHQKSKRWTAAAPLLISIKIDCLIWHWPRKLQGFLRFSFGEKSTEKQRSLSLFFFYVKSLNGAAANTTAAAAASRAFGDIFELFFLSSCCCVFASCSVAPGAHVARLTFRPENKSIFCVHTCQVFN